MKHLFEFLEQSSPKGKNECAGKGWGRPEVRGVVIKSMKKRKWDQR